MAQSDEAKESHVSSKAFPAREDSPGVKGMDGLEKGGREEKRPMSAEGRECTPLLRRADAPSE